MPPWSTLPQAPGAPGRWACPRPVLTLAAQRSPAPPVRRFRPDAPTPLPAMVCCHGGSLVPRPSLSADSCSCHGPRAPGQARGLPSCLVLAADHVSRGAPPCLAPTGSGASPPPSACLGAPLHPRSVPVAGSPGGEADLPDVLSAPLSLRAWPSPPAAREGHRPVASRTTAAVPPCGPGRRSTRPMPRLPHGARGEAAGMPSRAGPQVCSPPRALLPLRLPPSGSRGFSSRASRGS